jgi:hypothetical protein
MLNYDGLVRFPFQYRNMSKEASVTGSFNDLFFTIVEFSLDSVRRNKNNQITQANCRLSMIENRNPFQNITAIPKLQKPPRNKKCPEWKVCCPKKYKRNCPDPTKTPPSVSFTENNDTVAQTGATTLDDYKKKKDAEANAAALEELNK